MLNIKMTSPNHIWKEKGFNYILKPSYNEIQTITKLVSEEYNGYLPKTTCLKINGIYLFSNYDCIVIQGHLCSIIKLLGKGFCGKVFEGFDNHQTKMIAIKSQKDPKRSVVQRQIQTTAKNGIGLSDTKCIFGPEYIGNNCYFIIPLAETSFNKWVKKKGVIGKHNSILKGLVSVAEDISRLHKQKMVHLDIKTDNALVIGEEVYLSDFGRTQKEGTIVKSSNMYWRLQPHFDPNYFKGFSGKKEYIVDHRFDIYSFGKFIRDTSLKIKNVEISRKLHVIGDSLREKDPNDRPSLYSAIAKIKALM